MCVQPSVRIVANANPITVKRRRADGFMYDPIPPESLFYVVFNFVHGNSPSSLGLIVIGKRGCECNLGHLGEVFSVLLRPCGSPIMVLLLLLLLSTIHPNLVGD
jgi:hypothetical protein